MSSSNAEYMAMDIITYIGVPLAVLGVLPILYNTRSEYWQLARQPSQIPGGSWTTFHWKTNTIGFKTQRIEYADQLRQPQVEVAFDELVSYLLDLGAVPDAHGWKLLRSAGLWTPMGCSLMTAPGGQMALTIAPLDDSDGHLSLAVNWSSSWTTRDFSSLPPYWVRLPPPPMKPATPKSENSTSPGPVETEEGAEPEVENNSLCKESLDSIQKPGQANASTVITCQISVDGLVAALTQETEIFTSSSNIQSLYIEHLCTRSGRMDGVWFASAATAYGTTSQTVLWNYKIPDEILNFARTDTLPCGILVLLDVVEESQTPQWAMTYNTHEEGHEFVKPSTEQRLALQAEAKMTHEQQQIASRDRMQREMTQRMQDMRDKTRLKAQRREARTVEALQSPKWDTKLVAEHNLCWLKAQGHIDESIALKDTVGMLLHRIILDGRLASSVCKMLNLWKAWADNGGMRKSDFHYLQESPLVFAEASLLIATIKDTTTAQEGTLSMDLQECMKMWKTVRLG
ncbi:uncharacterized protein BCR38DRAFT_459270 [Pseudomassariella vexata]|uniref:Uncharacterized protein n=1 Tax=Pseudomassariella vexata TaxID=1141098 RepID=A0A1Y2DQ03_9PEZI|nr:uncharacterized protein BCR38DRAFT_459270 [Pseudomassariella vexata]ORY61372.1 hypothetical protein BCR38DRAFT_459270 [Pseudomassariella vexata]